MDWSSDADQELFGQGATEALQAADMASMVGDWPANTVLRSGTPETGAKWLWLTQRATLSCVAVAPWGDTWDVDVVADAAAFFGTMPLSWRVKATKKPKKTATERRGAWADYAAGWACGMMADKTAILCKVASVDANGQLVSVRTMEDGPDVPISAHTAKSWFGLTKWPNGLDVLWSSGRTHFANYRFLTICAGVAEDPAKRTATLKATWAAKKAAAKKAAAKAKKGQAPSHS